MKIKLDIKKCVFFLDDLGKKHYKLALFLKICLWILEPEFMIILWLAKRKIKKASMIVFDDVSYSFQNRKQECKDK